MKKVLCVFMLILVSGSQYLKGGGGDVDPHAD